MGEISHPGFHDISMFPYTAPWDLAGKLCQKADSLVFLKGTHAELK